MKLELLQQRRRHSVDISCDRHQFSVPPSCSVSVADYCAVKPIDPCWVAGCQTVSAATAGRVIQPDDVHPRSLRHVNPWESRVRVWFVKWIRENSDDYQQPARVVLCTKQPHEATAGYLRFHETCTSTALQCYKMRYHGSTPVYRYFCRIKVKLHGVHKKTSPLIFMHSLSSTVNPIVATTPPYSLCCCLQRMFNKWHVVIAKYVELAS